MIEVNLLPGATRRPTRRKSGGFSLGGSSSKSRGPLDRWRLLVAAGWIAGPTAVALMFFGARGQMAELNLSIEQAQRDSAHYAALIASTERLRARRDTIAQKLEIIQEIDAGRYVWPHIMDEVSRSVPAYTWLTGVSQLAGGPNPRFRIAGRTGNTFALTQFMKDLEASPFIRGVRLASTELVQDRNNNQRLVHNFMLEATYEEASPDMIETVPLFVSEE